MKKFRLKFASDFDDSNPKHYFTEQEPNVGETILVENGFHHCIYNKVIQKTGVRLDLAKSATSPAEATLLAEQAGLYPKTEKPRALRRRS